MAQDLIEKIRAAAQAKGVDPEVAVSIARAESGLDPNAKAKSSTASGLFQILNSTWSGNKGTPGKQFDSDENIRVGTDIISQNVNSLKKFLGRDPSPKEVYAAHYFGATGAQKFLTAAPDTPAKQLFSEKVLAANPNLQGKTAAQISAQLESKLKIPASNVSRETSVAKKEREPLPPSLPPMAQAEPKAATVAMASGKNLPDIKSMPASYQAAFALAALADTKDDEKEVDEDKPTETEKFFASYKPVNHLASLDLSVQPIQMADGGDVEGSPKNAKSLMEKFKDLTFEYQKDPIAFMRHYKVPTSPMGQGLNAGYAVYKHITGKDPLTDLQRELSQRLNPETDTGDADSMPISVGLPPIRRADGSPEEGEDVSKPYFGNPNIRKQGEAARRLAAMRDVNTLPDPKTYAAVAGAFGTRPDQMGFSVLNPKYKEIMDVANPAFYAGTALQIAPVAQGPGMGRMVGAAERALEPAVRRTLEGGGKASQMLQDLAAPPSQMFVRARPEAAARHADLQAQGLSPEQIRAQNLTLVDNRGNLLEEISDAPAVLQQKTASVPRMYYDMLKHPELQSIYPAYDMPDVLMKTTRRKDAPLAAASYGDKEGIEGVVRSLPGDDVGGMVRGTLLHEGQHAIQSIEGFTEGANPSSFVAYIKAQRGTYDSDPTVNENVIRQMERIYPNLSEVTDRIGQDLKARYGKVFPSDKRMGEALYKHMPGEVQAELARIRGNLTPEELKATPLETSMQQLNINPANILEMNKGGSRLDRQIGDLEYDVYGYADGGEVDMEGQEIKFATGQPQAPTSAPLPATRSAKELDAYIKALNPGAQISYFPERGDVLGHVSSKAQDILNIQRGLSPRSDEEVKLHELEHSLGFRGGDPLGRPKISKVDNNYKAYYMLGDWRPMSQFTQNMVENREKLEQFFGRPLTNAYFKPETLEVVRKQHGDTSALFDEQLASLSALEQITGKSLTRDPEMKKLFPNVRVMSVYDALTGPRQTRMDPRDLPPSTPQPAYTYRDNPVTQFLHKTLLGDNFYPYQKPVKRADGSPEEGERLTPQQIERIAAQETAEREAASNAAFIAQKSGIGRKAGPVSQALQSGQGQIEFLKGMTNVPQNILGAPMDISNMVASIYGGNVEKPFMGSEYLKEKSRAAGLGFKPSTDPTLAGFYGAGDLGSNLVNPAGVTRAGVQAAGKTGEAARMLAQDFQQYNQNLAVPGASYAIRNRSTPFIMTPERTTVSGQIVPEMNEADAYADRVARTVDTGANLRTDNPALANWFRTKVGAYLRRDFGTEQDQMVQAADKGLKMHFTSPRFLENNPYLLNPNTIGTGRELEGFPKAGFAKTAKGQEAEAIVDSSIYPLQLQDVSEKYVPSNMRQFRETNPEMRLSEMGSYVDENLKLETLADEMDNMFKETVFKAYGEQVPMPKDYILTEDTLKGLTPAQASNRVARKQEWVTEKRGELAGIAIAKDPQIVSHSYDNGSKWISPPDLADNARHEEMVKDIGCAGGWCTDKSTYALDYGSGENRLNILLDKKFEPRVQLTVNSPPISVREFILANPHLPEIDALTRDRTLTSKRAEAYIKTMPEYQDFVKQNQNTKSITEIKGQFNNADLKSSPYLRQVQDFVKRQGPELQTVDNLAGINMTDLRTVLIKMNRPFEQNYMNRLLKANGGSYFVDKDEASSLIKKVDEMPNNAARQIQMNMFQPPAEKAYGGMIERQPTDNRRYL